MADGHQGAVRANRAGHNIEHDIERHINGVKSTVRGAREVRPYNGFVGEERWTDFIEWARRARAKPTFDAEERAYRLAVADAVRELVGAAEEGRPLAELARAVGRRVMDSRYTMLPARPLEQLAIWAEDDRDALARALQAFARGGDDPVERLALFTAELERATGTEQDAAAVLVGSLMSFAAAPKLTPLVRSARYARLRELLGERSEPAPTLLEDYRCGLAFAHEVEAALRGSRVPIRDMIDVDALLRICATEEELWAGAGDAAVSRRTSEPEAYLAVCAIYRNEALYLAEWIEFHLLVGVERFFLYDNVSDDDHLEVLSPYIDDGIVVRHDWPGSSATGAELNEIQKRAYDHCISAHGAEARWIAVIDADEFLFSPTGRPASELLTEFERWPAVAVNCPRFGPAGRPVTSNDLVLENHTRVVDAWKGKVVKSIVDPSAVTGCMSSHRFECRRGATVDENGYPVLPHDAHMTQSRSCERLRINHYFARSEKELAAKHERRITDRPWYARAGRGDKGDSEEHDRAILGYVPALREALHRRAAVAS